MVSYKSYCARTKRRRMSKGEAVGPLRRRKNSESSGKKFLTSEAKCGKLKKLLRQDRKWKAVENAAKNFLKKVLTK